MTHTHFAKILGTGTLNDKGQLVIPSEARNSLGLKSGDKLVIMRSPDTQKHLHQQQTFSIKQHTLRLW
jgi:AbrB family looped-hinge helix DNA binding protein